MSLTFSEKTPPSTSPSVTWKTVIRCESIGVYVMVGSGGTGQSVATSTDGITWTLHAPAEDNTWAGLAFSSSLGTGNGRIVAVATSGTHRVMYSDDKGVTWTAATAASVRSWHSVAWSSTLSLFAAVSNTGTGGGASQVMTSSDGITWASRSAASALAWINVYWADGRFIAAASNNSVNFLMTSTNGTTWTSLTTPSSARGGAAASGGPNTIGFSSDLGMWLATYKTNGTSQYGILTSTDHGANWTDQAVPAAITPGNGLYGVQWSSELSTWLIITDNPGAITSANGTSWTFTSLTSVDAIAGWSALAYSAGLKVFVANNPDPADAKVLYVVGQSDSITPTSGNAKSNTVTITGVGSNGGFLVTGGTLTVTIYPGLAAIYGFDTNNPYAAVLGSISAPYGAATNVSASDAYTLTCTTPYGQGASDVLVFNNGASGPNILGWLPAGFTFSNPVITSLLPTSGPSSGGTAVTITGTNLFTGVLGGQGQVTFGGYYTTGVTVASATSITCTTPVDIAGSAAVDVVFIPPGLPNPAPGSQASFTYPNSTLAGAYTYVSSWWSSTVGAFTFYQYSLAQPTALSFDFGFFYGGIYYPAGTSFPFAAGVTPTDTGWWLSVDNVYAGAAQVVNAGVPRDPRSYHEITTFATGSAAWLGGFPGPCCVLNNHLVYAKGGYTAGTDSPTIHIFDGTFDRELLRLPNTSAGVVPKGVMTMLAANGTIYLSTFDTGTDSTSWVGRVFSLDVEAATLMPIGAAFTTGHIPYALAWHAGRLWCGTHRQSSAATGKIYWFRPGIDTAWTEDRDLTTDGMAGVSSMVDFQGNLYIGTTAPAASFAKVLKRDSLGAYTTSTTASGGAAAANNGVLALAEFSSKLYASFWNADTPNISKIYKFDGSSWSTSYTGSSGTLKPFVGFPTDNSVLLAIGGGAGYQAALVSTPDGITWSDRSAFLSQGTPASVGLPAFGVVVR